MPPPHGKHRHFDLPYHCRISSSAPPLSTTNNGFSPLIFLNCNFFLLFHIKSLHHLLLLLIWSIRKCYCCCLELLVLRAKLVFGLVRVVFTCQQMAFIGRFRELMKKYGKVALGVHFSVSATSIEGLYVVIKNNMDVESIFEKVRISGVSKEEPESSGPPPLETIITVEQEQGQYQDDKVIKKKNRTAELEASSGGALALDVLCNKALFPVRVPIMIALTPPIARFLARRSIIKSQI